MPLHSAITGSELHPPMGSDQANDGDLTLGTDGWFRIEDSSNNRVFNITESSSVVTISLEQAATVFQLNQRSGAATTTRAIYGRDVSGTDELFWYDGSAEVQLTSGGSVNGGGGGGTLDQSYDQGGAGAGRSITVDTGAVELVVDQAASTNYALDISYGAAAFTGTPHGILIDWSGATSLTNTSDVYGVRLVGETNAGSADSVGVSLDSGWDIQVEVGTAVTIGGGTMSAASNSIAFGNNVTSAASSVSIGGNSDSGTQSVSIGFTAQTTGNNGIALGYFSSQTGIGSVVAGHSASDSGFQSCVVLGRSGDATANNQFVVGSSSYEATTWYGPGGPTGYSGPSNWTLQGSPGSTSAGANVVLSAGASDGTNQAGSILRLSTGTSTGNAVAGNFSIQTPLPGSSGSGVNSTSDRLVIEPNEANYNTDGAADGGWHWATGEYTQTTATTAETAWTLPTTIPSNSSLIVRAMVTASYDNTSTIVSAAYDDFYCHFESASGTVSIVNGGTPNFISENNGASVCTLDTDGTDIRLRVTNPTADTCLWAFKIDWVLVTTP